MLPAVGVAKARAQQGSLHRVRRDRRARNVSGHPVVPAQLSGAGVGKASDSGTINQNGWSVNMVKIPLLPTIAYNVRGRTTFRLCARRL